MSGRKASGGWSDRKSQLQTLLDCCGDDEEQGIALDQALFKSAKEGGKKKCDAIETARFSDKDVSSFGPLAEAQFGKVELVSCRLDGRVYVRKRISKKFALKARDQCSPLIERRILLLALNSRLASSCTPRMLCAYQCPDHLNILMEYAQGGSLWDILESSSSGRLSAADLSWWAPQCVSALAWLHERANFVHRDVKPHNFVVRLEEGESPRLLLIDFGSAAALEEKDATGVQKVARKACLVPCGTCDYISPEILKAHEEALVSLEMSDGEVEVAEREDESDIEFRGNGGSKGGNIGRILKGGFGYGRETDWWSLGAMLYELAFGTAPFFASDIRQTYSRIMNHESNLSFDRKLLVPPALVSFIKGCLTHHETRLGRHSDDDVKKHPYFRGIDWNDLSSRTPPPDLLLPQFSFEAPLVPSPAHDHDLSSDSNSSDSKSRPFAFSQLFQSSTVDSMTPSRSFVNSHLNTPAFAQRSLSRSQSALHDGLAAFIGFSWGPPKDAFDDATRSVPAESGLVQGLPNTPSLLLNEPSFNPQSLVNSTMKNPSHPFVTPIRPSHSRRSGTIPPSTIRVTASAKRRAPGSGSATRAGISDRDAMRMLVNCVGMSARKKVLESGKKPRVLIADNGFGPPPPQLAMDFSGRDRTSGSRDGDATPTITINGTVKSLGLGRTASGSAVKGDVRKELRFDDTTTMHFAPPVFDASQTTNTFTNSFSRSLSSHSRSNSLNSTTGFSTGMLPTSTPHPPRSAANDKPAADGAETETDNGVATETETGSECPPSPSPSPRPGSAMSMLSINRTRSGTPTASYLFSSSLAREKSASTIGMGFPGSGDGADRRMMRRTASSASMSGLGWGNNTGSLGTVKASSSSPPQRKKVNDGEVKKPTKVGFAVEGIDGDVDFDVGKTPMKGREKRKVASTPHPLARASSAPEQKTPGRKARFDVDSSMDEDSEAGEVEAKPASTPYPRGKGRTRFDVDSSLDGGEVAAAKKVVSTPHPRARATARFDLSEEGPANGRDDTEDMRRAFEEALETPKPARNLISEKAKAKGTPHPLAKSIAPKPLATPAKRKSTVEDEVTEENMDLDTFEDDGDTIRPARQTANASPDLRQTQESSKLPNSSAIPTSTRAVLGTPLAESTFNDDKANGPSLLGLAGSEVTFEYDSAESTETDVAVDRQSPERYETQSGTNKARRGRCEGPAPERGSGSGGYDWRRWAERAEFRLSSSPKANTNTDEGAHLGRGAPFITERRRSPPVRQRSMPLDDTHVERERVGEGRLHRSWGSDMQAESTFISPGSVSRLSEYRSVDVGKREGEDGRWEEMERRFARLRMDIANVSAHLEEFGRWAGTPPRVRG